MGAEWAVAMYGDFVMRNLAGSRAVKTFGNTNAAAIRSFDSLPRQCPKWKRISVCQIGSVLAGLALI